VPVADTITGAVAHRGVSPCRRGPLVNVNERRSTGTVAQPTQVVITGLGAPFRCAAELVSFVRMCRGRADFLLISPSLTPLRVLTRIRFEGA